MLSVFIFKPGSEAMFADLGHFNKASIQVQLISKD